jgi:hypothetical protein
MIGWLRMMAIAIGRLVIWRHVQTPHFAARDGLTLEQRRQRAQAEQMRLAIMRQRATHEVKRTETIFETFRSVRATGLWATDLLAARKGRDQWGHDGSIDQ